MRLYLKNSQEKNLIKFKIIFFSSNAENKNAFERRFRHLCQTFFSLARSCTSISNKKKIIEEGQEVSELLRCIITITIIHRGSYRFLDCRRGVKLKFSCFFVAYLLPSSDIIWHKPYSV